MAQKYKADKMFVKSYSAKRNKKHKKKQQTNRTNRILPERIHSYSKSKLISQNSMLLIFIKS